MSAHRDNSAAGDGRSAVEGVISHSLEDERRTGRPLSGHALRYRRSVEDYLKAGAPPRWMQRLTEIDRGILRERRRLEAAYAKLAADSGGDLEAFAERWEAIAAGWSFAELNTLIGQHNDWYPIERDLPMDPRTGEYVRVRGRSYRREPLDAGWVLRHFPARPAPGP